MTSSYMRKNGSPRDSMVFLRSEASSHNVNFSFDVGDEPVKITESDKLQGDLGHILPKCLHDVIVMRPVDPIEFIARWLYRFVDNQLYYAEKAAYEMRLEEERQAMVAERLKQQQRMKRIQENTDKLLMLNARLVFQTERIEKEIARIAGLQKMREVSSKLALEKGKGVPLSLQDLPDVSSAGSTSLSSSISSGLGPLGKALSSWTGSSSSGSWRDDRKKDWGKKDAGRKSRESRASISRGRRGTSSRRSSRASIDAATLKERKKREKEWKKHDEEQRILAEQQKLETEALQKELENLESKKAEMQGKKEDLARQKSEIRHQMGDIETRLNDRKQQMLEELERLNEAERQKEAEEEQLFVDMLMAEYELLEDKSEDLETFIKRRLEERRMENEERRRKREEEVMRKIAEEEALAQEEMQNLRSAQENLAQEEKKIQQDEKALAEQDKKGHEKLMEMNRKADERREKEEKLLKEKIAQLMAAPQVCYWELREGTVLVCIHPELGELHRPKRRDFPHAGSVSRASSWRCESWYDHELYTLCDPHFDDDVYESVKKIKWTSEGLPRM